MLRIGWRAEGRAELLDDGRVAGCDIDQRLANILGGGKSVGGSVVADEAVVAGAFVLVSSQPVSRWPF